MVKKSKERGSKVKESLERLQDQLLITQDTRYKRLIQKCLDRIKDLKDEK